MGVLRRQIRLQQKGSPKAGLPIRSRFVQGIPGRIKYHENLGKQLSKALEVIKKERDSLILGKPPKKLLRAHLRPEAKGLERVKRTAADTFAGGVGGGLLGGALGISPAPRGQVEFSLRHVGVGVLGGAILASLASWRGAHEDRAVRELQKLLKKRLYVVKREETQLTEYARLYNEQVLAELEGALKKLIETNSEKLGYLELYAGKPNR